MTPYVLVAVGVIGGGLIVWLLMKGKIALADAKGRGAGEVERTTLSEQLKAASHELEAKNIRLGNAEDTVQTQQTKLEERGRECAQLSERAERLAKVETEHLQLEQATAALKNELADWREKNGGLTADVAAKYKRLGEIELARHELSTERDKLLRDQAEFSATIAELRTALNKDRTQFEEKLALLTGVREDMSNQFKATAAEILDEKTKKFTEQNQTNLTQLLDPFKEKIAAFQAKVEEVYVNEGKDRSALGTQVKMLTELNNALSKDAQNLALAIRGDRKTQGNWGEIMLDDVLERAGLVEGQHYDRQGGMKTEDGKTQILDVVVHLPGDRHIVIDSKMTLPDYRAFANADDDDERDAALKRHFSSVRAHMNGLSEKNYPALYRMSSLDFVVMFVPLEPAFMLAVTNDRELFQHGWDKNVLLVSPSTLLFVIRTVATLWRQEDLSRNARAISERGAELYDRLVGFVDELAGVGKRLDQAHESYTEAVNKLRTNKGNVIRQAEMLKGLGVKPSKALPAEWVDAATEDTLETPLIESNLAGPGSNPEC